MRTVPGSTGLRWGIYSRISFDKGRRGDGDDTVSMETQEAGCRALIARLDHSRAAPYGRLSAKLLVPDSLEIVRESIRTFV